jgi:hypothetical protein
MPCKERAGLIPVQGVLTIVEIIHNFGKVILNWNRTKGLIPMAEGGKYNLRFDAY